MATLLLVRSILGLLMGITFFFIDPPALPQGSMNVHVTIARDLLVNLNITLHNAVSESPHSTTVELRDHIYYRNPGSLGGTKVDEFLVEVVLNSGQLYSCSPVQPSLTSTSTLSLHANCSDLPIEELGNVTVTAINSNGSSNHTVPISMCSYCIVILLCILLYS